MAKQGRPRGTPYGTQRAPLIRLKWREQLIRDITIFHAATGMNHGAIGIRAIKDARFWERLHTNGRIGVETADEVYEFMAFHGFHFNDNGRIDDHAQAEKNSDE